MFKINFNHANHPEHEGEHEMENHIPPHLAMRPHMHHHPLPPHERRDEFPIVLDEKDEEVLKLVFHDDDTVSAAKEIIRNAPPEIKVLTIQIMKLIEETSKHEG